MRGMIDVALRAAGLSPHGAGRGIDAHALEARQIDDETVVAAAETRSVVSAAADRDQEILSAAEVHRRNHVGHVRAARNEARTLVDHAVVKLARLVIAVITRLNQGSAERLCEHSNGLFVEHDGDLPMWLL